MRCSIFYIFVDKESARYDMTIGIALTNIRFSYGKNDVIKNVDLEIGNTEIVSLVGPNGAGKTTLLKLIGGLLKPSHGEAHVMGQQIGEISPRSRAQIVSSVPQNPRLPQNVKLSEFVMLGRNAHLSLTQWESDEDIQVVYEALDVTDTLKIKERQLGKISGGELQRGMLALALAQNSPVMLLDEPTSNLDLSHQSKMMNLIVNSHESRLGPTVIAIHDLTLAARYSSRMILVSEGKVFADGTPEEVLTPANIKEAYGAEVAIIPHPEGGSPVVLPVFNSYPKTK
mgnify:FL=1